MNPKRAWIEAIIYSIVIFIVLWFLSLNFTSRAMVIGSKPFYRFGTLRIDTYPVTVAIAIVSVAIGHFLALARHKGLSKK
ncbi:hypothetical protein GOV09_03335 [Candidatus Woesearchaeota archaeon]|nr:hypothetical protein [Candidatus Woesearchaeota archaeon]